MDSNTTAISSASSSSSVAKQPIQPATSKPWHHKLPSIIPAILFFLLYLVLFILFLIYHKQLIPLIEQFATTVKNLGFWGYLIATAMTFITAFPPIPGYGLSATFNGLVFSWLGIIPTMVGAFLGACATFVLFRKIGYSYTQKLIAAHPKSFAIVRAIEQEGFKLLFLIRLAPYPFNLFNALFGISHVPFLHFALATVLTLPKDIVDVAIGANVDALLSDLLDHPQPWVWGVTIAFIVVAVMVTVWIGWIARRAVKRLREDETWRQQVEATAAMELQDEEEVPV